MHLHGPRAMQSVRNDFCARPEPALRADATTRTTMVSLLANRARREVRSEVCPSQGQSWLREATERGRSPSVVLGRYEASRPCDTSLHQLLRAKDSAHEI